MEKFAKISDVLEGAFTGKEVSIRGWIYRKRSSGGVQFIVIRDSSGTIQVAIKKENAGEAAFDAAEKALVESSVSAKGIVKEDKRAPGGYEISANNFSVLHFSEVFPISKDQSTEFLLDVRHLWLRSQKLTNAMKTRHHLVNYMREFLASNGFWEVSPPIITKAGCEGGSTLFPIKYFDEDAFLTQSAQLYNEVFITSLEKTFVLAPSFRAEKSRTTKHLAEYWHLEAEMAYFNNEDNMKLQEQLVSYACQKMAVEQEKLLKFFGVEPKKIAVSPPFNRISYGEALSQLKRNGIEKEWGSDFGADDEQALTKDSDIPLFIHSFPKEAKPFYMPLNPKNQKTVLNADLLAPRGHGEIVGGSERIWKLDELLARMKEQGIDAKDYEWYIDMRRYGSVPHSGFGLGVERLLKWILNLDHIRDAIPFPRVINRVYP